MARSKNNLRRAFTWVELVVLIVILGALLALLMPKLASTGSNSRSSQCKNNLHNIALACQSHRKAWNSYPSGGWGPEWTGDPDEGYGQSQPGGWAYSILPYLDQETLHELGKGLPDSEKQAAAQLRERTPVAIFYCPARRKPQGYPVAKVGGSASTTCFNAARPLTASDRNSLVARLDYAGCFGTDSLTTGLANGKAKPGVDYPASIYDFTKNFKPHPESWHSELFDGVIFRASQVQTIRGGESQTYLIGERNLLADHYEDGEAADDNLSAYVGFDQNNCRSGGYTPSRDHERAWWESQKLAATQASRFGSAHPNSFLMTFCNGSTHVISYDIDPHVHLLLSSRHADNMIYDEDGKVTGKEKKYVDPAQY